MGNSTCLLLVTWCCPYRRKKRRDSYVFCAPVALLGYALPHGECTILGSRLCTLSNASEYFAMIDAISCVEDTRVLDVPEVL